MVGRWWLAGSGGKVLRVVAGKYEPEQTREFQRVLKPGDTVLDVGAHVGYYTLLSSVLVGRSGQVLAFEPNPRNFAYLERHIALNRLPNASALPAAVADQEGVARFEFGKGSGTGHLATDGSLQVRTVRLDAICADRGLAPNVVKVDVEGAELSVLEGGRDLFASRRPVVFLSTHGEPVHGRCLEWLADAGYAMQPIIGADLRTTSEVLCTPRPR